MKTALLYWSKTGNTRTFVDFFVKHSTNEVDLYDMKKNLFKPHDLLKYDKICIGTYTWGYGKIPKEVKQFFINNQDLLSDKIFFLYGSGNSVYPKFCGAIDNLEIILEDLNSEIFFKFKIDQRFNEDDFDNEKLDLLSKKIKDFSEVKI